MVAAYDEIVRSPSFEIQVTQTHKKKLRVVFRAMRFLSHSIVSKRALDVRYLAFMFFNLPFSFFGLISNRFPR